MKFDEFAIGEAEGAVLAHSVRVEGVMLKKGRVLTSADIAALRGANISRITVARLDTSDVTEDEAAQRVAIANRGAHVEIGPAFTGGRTSWPRRMGW